MTTTRTAAQAAAHATATHAPRAAAPVVASRGQRLLALATALAVTLGVAGALQGLAADDNAQQLARQMRGPVVAQVQDAPAASAASAAAPRSAAPAATRG